MMTIKRRMNTINDIILFHNSFLIVITNQESTAIGAASIDPGTAGNGLTNTWSL